MDDVPVVDGGQESEGRKKRHTTTVLSVKTSSASRGGAGRSVFLLLFIAAVALGVYLLINYFESHDFSKPGNWMKLVSSLQAPLQRGQDLLEKDEDHEYGALPNHSGKVLIWSLNSSKPEKFGIASPALAGSPAETRTVVFVDMGWEDIGEYPDGSPRRQHVAKIYVVDVNGIMLNYALRLAGSEPPDTKTDTGVQIVGSMVNGKLKTWLVEFLKSREG